MSRSSLEMSDDSQSVADMCIGYILQYSTGFEKIPLSDIIDRNTLVGACQVCGFTHSLHWTLIQFVS